MKKQILIGIAIGLVAILLNTLFPSFAIGFPVIPQATQGEQTLIVGVLAPLGEEFIFRSILLGLLTSGFLLSLSLLPAAILNGLIFALFHFRAYGASLSATSASFILAGLFGAGMVYLTRKYDKSKFPIPIASIMTHAVFNLFLLSKFYIAVGI